MKNSKFLDRLSQPDWRRACAAHQHQRAANCDDGPYQAGQRVGCAHGNHQVAQHVHQPCSACLRLCACRGGTLLPVLYVCVSSYGPESWYLGRSTSVTNSVLTTGIPERVLIIREPAGPTDPCRRKRVNPHSRSDICRFGPPDRGPGGARSDQIRPDLIRSDQIRAATLATSSEFNRTTSWQSVFFCPLILAPRYFTRYLFKVVYSGVTLPLFKN